MRTVYVDVLIIVNLFIDYLLLLGAAKLLRLRTKLPRMMLAGAVGGIWSLAALLPQLPFWLNLPLDLLGAALLTIIAFGKTDVKSFLRRTAVFFAESFFFCGIMIFVLTAFRPRGMEVYNNVVYFNISPILLIMLTLVCYYVMKLIRFLSADAVGKPMCSVKLMLGGKEYTFHAMVDTGCHVKEPFSGADVIVAEEALFAGNPSLYFQYRIIPFESLGGEGVLKGISAQQVTIDGKETATPVYVGVCNGVLKGSVKAIVPYSIVK